MTALITELHVERFFFQELPYEPLLVSFEDCECFLVKQFACFSLKKKKTSFSLKKKALSILIYLTLTLERQKTKVQDIRGLFWRLAQSVEER